MNRVEFTSVSVHMWWMDMLKFLVLGMTVGVISSCAQKEYVDVETSGIQHSSPGVISLYENQNEQMRKQERSGGFFSWLIDGMLGSDPDDDDFFGDDRYERRRDSSRKRERFVSKNGDALRSKLESKKQ